MTKNKKLGIAGLALATATAGGVTTYRSCGPEDIQRACALCLAAPDNPNCQQLLASGVCGTINPTPTPSPTIEPTPTPTPQECLPLIPWCNELTPPAQCSTKDQPCKHNPTSDPAHCELAPDCIVPTPPNPTPTPPVPGNCVPHPEDPNWGPPKTRGTSLFQEYTAVIKAVGDRCGSAAPDEKPQNETLDRIAKKWTELYGRCASRWSDAVAVKANDGLFEEWHAVYFGNGCTIEGSNAYKGAWPYIGVPPVDDCPAPKPNKAPTAWKINCGVHNQWIDCTPTTVMQCDYCAAIGMGTIGGTIRCGCPMRNEGNPDRVACELYVAGGSYIMDSRNGASCTANPTNPLQFHSNNGNCRVCNSNKSVCGAWY